MNNSTFPANYHTHTRFSDGSHNPEIYIEEAISQGFQSFGFSDHSPLPFENRFAIQSQQSLIDYSTTVRSLKKQYNNDLEVYLGIEADFIPGITEPFSALRKNAGLEYIIGGVHLVKKENDERLWFIDGPKVETYDQGLNDIFGGDILNAVKTYYYQLMQMIETQKPEVVAHLDKINMHNQNRYFREDEKWYQQLVLETLEVIRQNGTIVEVNTRGIYKKRSRSLFPNPEILKLIKQMDIPVIISSDAHQPAEIAMYFSETKNILKELEFETIFQLTSNGWQPQQL